MAEAFGEEPPLLADPDEAGIDPLTDQQIIERVDIFIDENPDPASDAEDDWGSDSDYTDSDSIELYSDDDEIYEEKSCKEELQLSRAVKAFQIGEYERALTEFEKSPYIKEIENLVEESENSILNRFEYSHEFCLCLHYMHLLTKIHVAKDVKEINAVLDCTSEDGSLTFLVQSFCEKFSKIAPLHHFVSCQAYLKMNDCTKAQNCYKSIEEWVKGHTSLLALHYPSKPDASDEGKIIPETELKEGDKDGGFKVFLSSLEDKISAVSKKSVLFSCYWCEMFKEKSEWDRKQVYEDDLNLNGLFTGRMNLTCNEECSLNFHINKEGQAGKNCWELFRKYLKNLRGYKKPFEFGKCLTPTCGGKMWFHEEFDNKNEPVVKKWSPLVNKMVKGREEKEAAMQAAAISKKDDKGAGRSRVKSESKPVENKVKTKGKINKNEVNQTVENQDTHETPTQSLSREHSPGPSTGQKWVTMNLPEEVDLDIPLEPLVKDEIEENQGFQEGAKKKKAKKNKNKKKGHLSIPQIFPKNDGAAAESSGFGELPVAQAAAVLTDWEEVDDFDFEDVISEYDRVMMIKTLYESDDVHQTFALIYDMVRQAQGRKMEMEGTGLEAVLEEKKKDGGNFAQLYGWMGQSMEKVVEGQYDKQYLKNHYRDMAVTDGWVHVLEDIQKLVNTEVSVNVGDEEPLLPLESLSLSPKPVAGVKSGKKKNASPNQPMTVEMLKKQWMTEGKLHNPEPVKLAQTNGAISGSFAGPSNAPAGYLSRPQENDNMLPSSVPPSVRNEPKKSNAQFREYFFQICEQRNIRKPHNASEFKESRALMAFQRKKETNGGKYYGPDFTLRDCAALAVDHFQRKYTVYPSSGPIERLSVEELKEMGEDGDVCGFCEKDICENTNNIGQTTCCKYVAHYTCLGVFISKRKLCPECKVSIGQN